MAFTSAITDRSVMGNKRVHFGTYNSAGGSTGGNINTGLKLCEHLQLQPGGAAAEAVAPVVNETLPVDGSAVTIVSGADDTGYWQATGY